MRGDIMSPKAPAAITPETQRLYRQFRRVTVTRNRLLADYAQAYARFIGQVFYLDAQEYVGLADGILPYQKNRVIFLGKELLALHRRLEKLEQRRDEKFRAFATAMVYDFLVKAGVDSVEEARALQTRHYGRSLNYRRTRLFATAMLEKICSTA